MKILILGFTENLAICENEGIGEFHILRSQLPQDAMEWDVLNLNNDNFEFDFYATSERWENIIQHINKFN
jgi:hypothetical protein